MPNIDISNLNKYAYEFNNILKPFFDENMDYIKNNDCNNYDVEIELISKFENYIKKKKIDNNELCSYFIQSLKLDALDIKNGNHLVERAMFSHTRSISKNENLEWWIITSNKHLSEKQIDYLKKMELDEVIEFKIKDNQKKYNEGIRHICSEHNIVGSSNIRVKTLRPKQNKDRK